MIAWLLVACRGDLPVQMVEGPTLPVADSERVRFVALGDSGKGNRAQRRVADAVVRHCALRGCDFVVLLGDLVYPRGIDGPADPDADLRILAPYAAAGVPLLAVPGNHDYAHGSDRERVAWLLQWASTREEVVMPGHAWVTTAGPVTLIGLDTADAIRFGAQPQLDWLEARLADVPADAWVVGVGHHPRWSNGPHGNAGAYEGWTGVPWMSGGAVKRLLEPLEPRARLYLAGHDHSRQVIDHHDMVQIVSGAGASVTEVVDRGNTPRFASATLGFAWVEIGADAAVVELVNDRGDVDWATTIPRKP